MGDCSCLTLPRSLRAQIRAKLWLALLTYNNMLFSRFNMKKAKKERKEEKMED